MIRRPPRSTRNCSSAASDVYKRQLTTSLTLSKLSGLPLSYISVHDSLSLSRMSHFNMCESINQRLNWSNSEDTCYTSKTSRSVAVMLGGCLLRLTVGYVAVSAVSVAGQQGGVSGRRKSRQGGRTGPRRKTGKPVDTRSGRHGQLSVLSCVCACVRACVRACVCV